MTSYQGVGVTLCMQRNPGEAVKCQDDSHQGVVVTMLISLPDEPDLLL